MTLPTGAPCQMFVDGKWTDGSGGSFAVPRIVDIRAGSSFGGSDYIGMKPSEASVVRSVGLFGLTTGPLGLALLLGGAVAAWLSESRRRRPAA